ncbi:tetratricopeptide repeat protein [Mycolicibacterium madagascariense]|uniref:tetratricopeptide repeat protein n=1 Tax=Mycolicibacterium madagascariense TaxID=212765 RepID=UPI0013D668A7
MPDGPQGCAAAEAALGRGDLGAAEELGRAALRDGESLAARLIVAQALAWQGRGRDADAVLAEVDETALDESDLIAWALPRAANQFWMLDQPERATAFLRTVRRRVSSDGPGATLDALLGTFTMNAGSPERAIEISRGVLSSPDADQQAIGWAAAAAALCHARMGTFAGVDELAARASAAGHPGLLRFTSAFGQTTALVMSGRLDRAQALAEELADASRSSPPAHAIGQLLVAEVMIARGDPAGAAALLEPAANVLAPTGYSWGPLAWMLLAQALGQAGLVADAGRTLARAESRHGLKSMLFAPELCLARGWAAAARGDGPESVGAAHEAARAAERGGQAAVALRALVDAVRFGDTRAVDAIERSTVDCAVSPLAVDYARALAAGDADALDAAAEAFDGIGMHGVAADAARQAGAARR